MRKGVYILCLTVSNGD